MITPDDILELGFTKDEQLSTNEMSKFDFLLERKDLHPLYTYTKYTLYWDKILDYFNLIGQVSQNDLRVYYTNRYDGNITDKGFLKAIMRKFLFKDLKGSPILKKLQ